MIVDDAPDISSGSGRSGIWPFQPNPAPAGLGRIQPDLQLDPADISSTIARVNTC